MGVVHSCCVSIDSSFLCLHVCAYAFKFKVYRGSALGRCASGLHYCCTPPVTSPGVIGRLTVWRHINTKQIDRGKKSLFYELFSRNLKFSEISNLQKSVLLILWGWSGFINPQSFERLFSKKKFWRKSPRGWSVVKCWEFEGIKRFNEFCPLHEITGFTLKKILRIRILREYWESRNLFFGHIWLMILRPASFSWVHTHWFLSPIDNKKRLGAGPLKYPSLS